MDSQPNDIAHGGSAPEPRGIGRLSRHGWLEHLGGATVVHLGRAIDRLAAPIAGRILLEALEYGRGVIADLSMTTYLDGGAIEVLQTTRVACQACDIRFVVVAPPESLPRRVLDRLRLTPPLPVAGDLDEALALLASSES